MGILPLSLLPEFILILMEFPASFVAIWIVTWFGFVQEFSLYYCFTLVFVPLSAVGMFIVWLLGGSYFQGETKEIAKEYEDWIEIVDPSLKSWKGTRMPIREAYEWYFTGKINFTRPLLEVFLHRHEIFRFIFSMGHLLEFLDGVVRKAWLNHDGDGDHGEVTPVYNLGNDFYYAFLSDPMFYSCGIAYENEDSLDTAQKRKCGVVAEQLQIKDGDRIVDFGCGWGSWLIYCAQNFDVECIGLTISQCQFNYAVEKISKLGLEDKITIRLIDYREMVPEKFGMFDKITCFEMSEHVGIRNYQDFVAQIRSLLKPSGLFFLQIAGLRRAWQYEDLIWGVFMGKYIFPGADASCPLYWDINQLERGGMEVYSVKNQGVHYAHTIEMWYHNLVKNREQVIEKYDKFAYRRHEVFLAWSTMIARQGSSTVWTIIASHNTPVDQYSVPAGDKHSKAKDAGMDRTAKFINKKFFTTEH